MATKRDIAAARRRFAKETRRQTRSAAALLNNDRRDAIAALQQFNMRIRAVATTSLITTDTLAFMRNGAAAEVAALEAELSTLMESSLVRAAVQGEQMVLGPLSQVVPSITGGIQGISSFVASIAADFSADLIGVANGGLAAEVLKRVNTELTLAALGVRDQGTVVAGLQRITAFAEGRATTIFRTEVGRMMSMATQASLESAAAQIPGLNKAWLWSGVERVDHAQAEADFGPGKGIPVDEDFIVAGEALAFPRDAAGSPENTINCMCSEQPDLADGPLGEALDMAA